MKILALLIALCGALISPALSAQRIMFDGGGRLDVYIERYNESRRNDELVVIDGFCISACTLVTGMIRPERLCATPFARLAFHSAAFLNPKTGERRFAREGTRIMWHTYPPRVRELLLRRGWQDGMDHEQLIYVEGDDLYSIIRPCTPADLLKMSGVAASDE